jgi:lipoprotein-releasing system permease protein
MLGVFVGSAALIIILSVFNGFETLILSMYNTFTPEIRIEPTTGKTFNPNSAEFLALKRDLGVASFSEVLQEKALLRYSNSQFIGTVKGVADNYATYKNLDSTVLQGSFTLKKDGEDFAVIGSAVQNYLSVNINDELRDIEVYSPKKGGQNSVNPADEFSIKTIHPSGVFVAQQQFDDLLIVPLTFARSLLDEETDVSFIELNLKPTVSVDDFQLKLKKDLGKNFLVKNRSEQNTLLYKILNSEKWAIFMILTFVLVIAIFNIIGSLTMLVIDKKKDISILTSLGADRSLIRNIFFSEGMMISLIGCILGMAVGFAFCLLQQHFGFIKMGAENLITSAYPITIQWTDSFLVFSTVIVISTLASFISSHLSVKQAQDLKGSL